MSIGLCILASGSSGNCSLLRAPAGVVMIDAGLSPRETARRLDGTGVSIADIRAICLTHLDGDHFQNGWQRFIVRNGIRVFCSHRHRRALVPWNVNHRLEPFVRGVETETFEPVAGVAARAIGLRHDQDGSSGYIFESRSLRLGYATDLGRVPPGLVQAFAGVDVLAIESNYDPRMQIESDRPSFLKNRIMGGHGHLSNEQAFEAVVRVLNQSERDHGKLPSHVVLLHRSRECNCPDLLRELFRRDARLADRLVLAEQHARTEWIVPVARPPARGQQLTFVWHANFDSPASVTSPA